MYEILVKLMKKLLNESVKKLPKESQEKIPRKLPKGNFDGSYGEEKSIGETLEGT